MIVHVELAEADIESLVTAGLLRACDADNPKAVAAALHGLCIAVEPANV